MSAVIFREGKARMGRNFMGLFAQMGQLGVAITIFSLIRYFTGQGIHRGMDIVPFVATGVIMFWTFRNTMQRVAVTSMMAYNDTFFPQVTPLDVAIARGVVNITLFVLLGFLAFGIFILVGVSHPIYRPAYVAMLILVSGFYGLFAGMILHPVLRRFRLFRPVLTVVLRVLLLTSGVFFVIPEIPYLFHDYALWNPLLHLSDIMRQEYFGTYSAEYADFGYAMRWLVGLILFGLITERAARRSKSFI
ncbi:ABC transporter permease [Zavarzinia compransoris]|uniref:ABC transporter permease n=1 Tax=Zavarzinia marina TaxID=2911065 RepID=UPI001F442C89|nr:ABC transporter permease [Zavarzinia marina]MCF4167618.1 ABC transporter permease [Zavarzinia marina]